MNRIYNSFAALTLGLSLSACAATEEALKPYPAAERGFSRHVIELPSRDNEAEAQVELIAGKTLATDCNQHRLGGQWQEKTVEGWGYGYYQLDKVGPMMSTLMACPDANTTEAFVQLGGEPMLVRYNSKLPLVIYAPSDVEVRYRIWLASNPSKAAPRR